jgi:hypothetical protein
MVLRAWSTDDLPQRKGGCDDTNKHHDREREAIERSGPRTAGL